MEPMGHEDAFPRPRLSARCRFSQGTFAGASGNAEDAPEAAVPLEPIKPQGFDFRPASDRSVATAGLGEERSVAVYATR